MISNTNRLVRERVIAELPLQLIKIFQVTESTGDSVCTNYYRPYLDN